VTTITYVLVVLIFNVTVKEMTTSIAGPFVAYGQCAVTALKYERKLVRLFAARPPQKRYISKRCASLNH